MVKIKIYLFIILALFIVNSCDLNSGSDDPLESEETTENNDTSNDESENPETTTDETPAETSYLTCDAGENQNITALGATVTLTGTRDSSEEDGLTYSWTASDSNRSDITITNADSQTASFNVPYDAREGDYEFTFTVSNGTKEVSDKVTVNLEFVNIITKDVPGWGEQLGDSVSLSSDGTIALIGVPGEAKSIYDDVGAAYIYKLTDSEWVMIKKITPSDYNDYCLFGETVSLSSDGKVALIGAQHSDHKGNDFGAAFIYSGDNWSDEKILTASDGKSYDRFGCSVSISANGSIAVIGAFFTNPSTAYVYSGANWGTETKLISPDPSSYDCFGYNVSISSDGSTAIVGSKKDDDKAEDAGAAYVFSGNNWQTIKKITPTDGNKDDDFGYCVDLSADGKTAIIGSPCNDNDFTDAGAVYIYSGIDWNTEKKIIPSDAKFEGYFGNDVFLTDDCSIALIGNHADSSYTTHGGAVYFYSGADWNTEKKVVIRGSREQGAGESLSLSSDGSTAIFGAPLLNHSSSAIESGCAYIYSFE